MTTVPWQQLMDSASSGFEVLPASDYEIQVSGAEPAKTSNGKDMLKCVFTVVEGPHANRKIWNNFVLSPENPNAMSFFFQHMGALGLDRAYFAQNPTFEQVGQALLNRPAKVTLSIRQYQGQDRNEVTKIVPSQRFMAGAALPVAAAPAPAMPVPTVATPAPAPAAAPMAPAPAVPVPAAPAAPAAPVAPAPPMPVAPPAPVAPMPVPAAAPVAAPAPVAAAPEPVAASVAAPVPPPMPAPQPAPVAAPVAPALPTDTAF